MLGVDALVYELCGLAEDEVRVVEDIGDTLLNSSRSMSLGLRVPSRSF